MHFLSQGQHLVAASPAFLQPSDAADPGRKESPELAPTHTNVTFMCPQMIALGKETDRATLGAHNDRAVRLNLCNELSVWQRFYLSNNGCNVTQKKLTQRLF